MTKFSHHLTRVGSFSANARVVLSLTAALSLASLGLTPAYASTVTITYSNQGASSGSAPSAGTVNQNTTASLSGPGTLVKSGLSFRGWSTAANGGGNYYPYPGNIEVTTENITLYPTFGGSVNFVSAGGIGTPSGSSLQFRSGLPPSLDYVENRPFTLPSQGTLQRNGFNFSGWRHSPTSSEFSPPGSSFTIPAGTPNFLNLPVAWTRTVQFSALGAAIGSAPPVQTWLESTAGLTIPSAIDSGLLRRGFDHVGWATSPGGRPVGQLGFIPQAATTTLYAAWRAQPTRQRLKIYFTPRKAKLSERSIARLESLKSILNPTATFPKRKIKIFLGSWRHRTQSVKLGNRRIAAVRKTLRETGIVAKFITSNDSRSSGSARDARNNQIELISEWRN
jgi:hypothetical protein